MLGCIETGDLFFAPKSLQTITDPEARQRTNIRIGPAERHRDDPAGRRCARGLFIDGLSYILRIRLSVTHLGNIFLSGST